MIGLIAELTAKVRSLNALCSRSDLPRLMLTIIMVEKMLREKLSYLKSEFPPCPVAFEPLHSHLLNAIQKWAEQDKTAFVEAENGRTHSYRELLNTTLSVNAFLAQHGFGHRDVAGIVTRNCWQFVPIALGCMSRGGCLSGASPLFTNAELAQQFRDARTKVVFCMEYALSTVLDTQKQCPLLKLVIVLDGTGQDLPAGVVHFSAVSRVAPSEARLFNDVDPVQDMVCLPYSSGTTGPPKGVMITHKTLGAYLTMFTRHILDQVFLRMDPDWDFSQEHMLHFLPFYHMFGFIMILVSTLWGSTAVIMEKYEPELLFKSLQDYKIRVTPMVPPVLVFMANTPLLDRYDLSRLQFIWTAAAPAGQELINQVKKRIPSVRQISQAYGLTEQNFSHHPIYGEENAASVGRLMPNCEMKIVDPETGKLLPVGQVGEICTRSPTNTLGYFGRPDATKALYDSEGFMKTGDLGYLDQNGWTYVVDRLKELIKVKGLQVAPAELEDLLLAHPLISDCAVIGVPDPRAGQLPKAFVVRADPKLSAAEVQNYVKGKVASYKELAGGVEFIDEIPKSASGKILRRFLRDRKSKL